MTDLMETLADALVAMAKRDSEIKSLKESLGDQTALVDTITQQRDMALEHIATIRAEERGRAAKIADDKAKWAMHEYDDPVGSVVATMIATDIRKLKEVRP